MPLVTAISRLPARAAMTAVREECSTIQPHNRHRPAIVALADGTRRPAATWLHVMARHDLDYVLAKLDWMRTERIWPNGLRYLWTDAFGLVLYVSLYRQTGEQRWLDQAKWLVAEV